MPTPEELIAEIKAVVSPLDEADPNSINEFIEQRVNAIFNKPPLSVSDADLAVMVKYYRERRAKFILESQAKVPKAVAAAKKKAPPPTSMADAIAAMNANADLF